jgi:hypothetical protein
MGLSDWFDPTKSWDVVEGTAPDPGGPSLTLAQLPFGSPIEAARVLGRPDVFEWKSRRDAHYELLYARKGLRLRFRGGRLDQVSYLVGQDACTLPSFAPSRPLAPDGTRLSPEVDRARIVTIFGEPDPGGSDDECLQVFHGNGVISDFYLDDQGHLREWSLYPDD